MYVKNNTILNEIELYFNFVPTNKVLELLISEGWSYDINNGFWHNQSSSHNFQFADALLCSYLKYKIIKIGLNPDDKKYQEYVASYKGVLTRLESRKESYINIAAFQAFLNILQNIEVDSNNKINFPSIIEKEHNGRLDIAKIEYLTTRNSIDSDSFWEKYKKKVRYNGISCTKLVFECNLVCCGGIAININLSNIPHTGTISFNGERYCLESAIVEYLITTYVPQFALSKYEEWKKIQKEKISNNSDSVKTEKSSTEKDKKVYSEEYIDNYMKTVSDLIGSTNQVVFAGRDNNVPGFACKLVLNELYTVYIKFDIENTSGYIPFEDRKHEIEQEKVNWLVRNFIPEYIYDDFEKWKENKMQFHKDFYDKTTNGSYITGRTGKKSSTKCIYCKKPTVSGVVCDDCRKKYQKNRNKNGGYWEYSGSTLI